MKCVYMKGASIGELFAKRSFSFDEAATLVAGVASDQLKEEQSPAVRRVVAITNYYVSHDDPDDFIDMMPGTMELVVVSHYHYYRVGQEDVRQDVPAGSSDPDAVYLAEGDNHPESTLVISGLSLINEHTFKLDIDASKTHDGDNFILYFVTVGKAVKDFRWPDGLPRAGTHRSFQIHLHIGPSMDEYIRSLER